MSWQFLSRFRRGALIVIALALVALAVYQGTNPPHRAEVAIAVLTKILIAVIAVIMARLVQDIDDQQGR